MKLTQKQQAFVEAYLRCWNATQAALEAGYSRKTARQQGSRLLTNVDVRAAVDARMAELKVGADEALLRLADHARGTMRDFVMVNPENGEPAIDFRAASQANKLHLVKRFKVKKKRGDDWSETEVEVELYDAQRALELLGKHHGLFPNKVEVDWKRELADAGLNPDELLEKLTDELDRHLSTGAREAAANRAEASTGTD